MLYEELQETSEMNNGSINRVKSDIHNLRRPPSLSDSFAFTEQNIERASSFRYRELPTVHEDVGVVCEICPYELYVNLGLRFLFHICLISIFETIFFFHYVSSLENNGIVGTIDSFTNALVYSCSNLTYQERSWIQTYISPYINVSTILRNGKNMYMIRSSNNAVLYIQSWLYVVFFASAFGLLLSVALLQKMKVNVYSVVYENLGFVFMLAFYEYMFFTTIILPYAPISSQEITQNTVLKIENQCKIL